MRLSWLIPTVGCAALLLHLLACKGDEPDGGGAGSGDAGASGTAAGSGGAGTGGSAGSSGAGGAGGNAGSGGAGGMGGRAGSGGAAGSPRRPPDPRDDIGAPDGTPCEGDDGEPIECEVGEQCCPAGMIDMTNECVAPGTVCQNCTSQDCGAVLCDGPEDCPGQLCCLLYSSCKTQGAPCSGAYVTVRCEDACETTSTLDLRTVICKDARDCLDADSTCVERNRSPYVSECQ